MRCFSEDLEKGKPKETIVIMTLNDAKILIDALEYQCKSLPKTKQINNVNF